MICGILTVMGKANVSREERVRQVRAWQASGLSGRAFAAQSGISIATLSWWKRKLDAESVARKKQKRPARRAFVEVTPSQPTSVRSSDEDRIEVEVRGVKVRLLGNFNEGSLSRLLDVLEARS